MDTDGIYISQGDGVQVVNNLVYPDQTRLQNGRGAGIPAKNNLVERLVSCRTEITVDSTIAGPAGFVGGTGFVAENYRLSTDSPAVGGGVELPAVAQDYAGMPRQDLWDVGAFSHR